MMWEKGLLIPMAVEGFVLEENEELANIENQYFFLNGASPPLGNCVIPEAFTCRQMEKGVHIHWNLPVALLNSEQTDQGETKYFSLPDTWMVIRMWTEKGKIKRKAWVVESSFVSNGSGEKEWKKTSIPTFVKKDGLWTGAGENEEFFGNLGTFMKYGSDNQESGYYLDHITVKTGASMTFPVCYRECKTVFGFHDSMEEDVPGTYTYLVVGVYRSEKEDILYRTEKTDEFLEKMQWKLLQDGEVPHKCIFHGLLLNVRWKGDGKNDFSHLPDSFPDIYVADTSAEAVSAFIQEKLPTEQGLERVMNLMQEELLDKSKEDNPDAWMEAEELLHKRKFLKEPGEILYRIVENKGMLQMPLTEKEITKLQNLNCLTRETEGLNQKWKGLKREAHYAWWKYVSSYWQEDGSGREFVELTEQLLDMADGIRQKSEKKEKEQEIQKQALEETLCSMGWCLKKEDNQVYFTAAPPSVLLVSPKERRGRLQKKWLEDDQSLGCRIACQTMAKLRYGEKEMCIGKDDLSPIVENIKPDFPEIIEELITEAIWENPEYNPLLGNYFFSEQTADKIWVEAQGVPCDEVGIVTWEQPFIPLFLHWEISYKPARTKTCPDNSMDTFFMEELDWEPAGKEEKEEWIEISGKSILSSHGAEDFLHTYEKNIGKEEWVQILKDSQIFSQRLEGFPESLIMREEAPFFPIISVEDETEKTAKRLDSYLEDQVYLDSPRLENQKTRFFPIRAGWMKINRLWVIDSFGQIQDIPASDLKVTASEDFRTEKEGEILLRPRLPIPCKIIAEWIAEGEGESPVAGFFLPDFLEKRIQIHDEKGTLLGFLQRTNDTISWETVNDGYSIENTLKNFIESFRKAPKNFSAWMQYLDERFNHTYEEEYFFSLCFGRPLVLVKCRIGLMQQGLPPFFQQWSKELDCMEYDEMQFPVRMGDTRKIRDGFIGFYRKKENDINFNNFYAPELDAQEEGKDFIKKEDRLYFSMEKETEEILLLMEPAKNISLRCGFLPASRISLPDVFYRKQMEQMEILFPASPVLGEIDHIQLPLPGGGETEWNFYRQNDSSIKRKVEAMEELFQEGESVLLNGNLIPERSGEGK